MAALCGFHQCFTVFPKFLFLFRIGISGQRVRDTVFYYWNPGGHHAKIPGDSLHGQPPGHAETDVLAGPILGKEPIACLVIRVNDDVVFLPFRSPQVKGNHMGDQFQVRNGPIGELVRDGAREELMQ